jgi:tetratricopeptide (TPR) repeat protein/DNA-binding CsgD family transcriptional regulator
VLRAGALQRRQIIDVHLKEISGVSFTDRQIDILACLLHLRNYSKIATILGINSIRTVQTHVKHIRAKLGNRPVEHVVDLIEKSGKRHFFVQYYFHILVEYSFIKQLLKLKSLINPGTISYIKRIDIADDSQNQLLQVIVDHLKIANIAAAKKTTELSGKEFILHLINNNAHSTTQSNAENKSQQHDSRNVHLLFDKSIESIPSYVECYVDFRDKNNYYSSLFRLIEVFSDNKSVVQEIEREFIDEYTALCKSWGGDEMKEFAIALESRNQPKPLIFKLVAIIVIVSCVVAWGFFHNKSEQVIRSDLILPIETVLLERSKIIRKIDMLLKAKDKIQTVAIVGLGGAGKTVLARHYGRSRTKTQVVFELNAETKDTLVGSLRSLAYSLADTSELKSELHYIQQIENREIQEKQLLHFIQAGLRKSSDWLLIYDNVDDLSQNYHLFPHDVKQWGSGSVIITTQDEHIGVNNYIAPSHIIKIKELDDEEKLTLFVKILYGNRFGKLGQEDREKITDFLKHIPPFPLDVSVAAYYINDTNISLEQYLERINNASEEFYKAQESLLKNIGGYVQTRYGIIQTTIGRIIENNPEYTEPLFLMGLVDSQNIPIDLFENYNNKIEVERFFYELKKFSIIAQGASDKYLETFKTFSIHRSTQELLFAFLTKKLGTDKIHQLSRNLWPSLKPYLLSINKNSDFFRMKMFVSHGDSILDHEKFLDKHVAAELYHITGRMHQLLGHYQKTFSFFDRSISLYKMLQEKKLEVFSAADLGYTYCIVGRYKEAIKMLTPCLEYIKTHYSSDQMNIAKTSLQLATANKYAGNYKESIDLLKQTAEIYRKLGDDTNATRALVHLGHVYTLTGNYKEARRLLENGVKFFKEKNDEFAYAWSRRVIGGFYNHIGFYDKARESSQHSLAYYSDLNGKKHIKITEILENLSITYLNLNNLTEAQHYTDTLVEINQLYYERETTSNMQGEIYAAMGKYDLAKEILEQKIDKYSQYHGAEHVRTAEVINSLGNVYLLQKDFAKAEELFKKALNIFQKRNHPNAYMALENLSELYSSKNNSLAKDYLVKALQIAEDALPADSPYITRLRGKLEKLKSH